MGMGMGNAQLKETAIEAKDRVHKAELEAKDAALKAEVQSKEAAIQAKDAALDNRLKFDSLMILKNRLKCDYLFICWVAGCNSKFHI